MKLVSSHFSRFYCEEINSLHLRNLIIRRGKNIFQNHAFYLRSIKMFHKICVEVLKNFHHLFNKV